jgi:hypothetical protein
VLDEAGVLAKFGVPPERIVDYLALVGDTVDNVPGVAKVGPKTAVKWLAQYGSLDNHLHLAPVRRLVGQNQRSRPDRPRHRNNQPRLLCRAHCRRFVVSHPGEACYIPLAHTAPGAPDQLPRDEVLAKLKPWLEAVDRRKVLQNAKYDQHIFANHDIALAGIVHDTMLESYVLESDKGHDLGQLAAAISDSPPLPMKNFAARVPSRSPSIRSISNAPPPTLPKMPTSRCASITPCILNSTGKAA